MWSSTLKKRRVSIIFSKRSTICLLIWGYFTLSLFHSFSLSLIHSFTLSLFHSITLSLFHSFITLSLYHSLIPWKLFHSLKLTHTQNYHESFLREYRYFLYKVKNSLCEAIRTEYASSPNLFGIHSSESLAQFWGKSEEEDVYRINDLLEFSIDDKRDFGSERVYIKKKKQSKGATLTSSLFSALSSEEVSNNHLKQLEASINLAMRTKPLFSPLIHRFQRGGPPNSANIQDTCEWSYWGLVFCLSSLRLRLASIYIHCY